MYAIYYPSGDVFLDGVKIVPGSPEFDVYLDWLAAGNGPEPRQDDVTHARITVSAWQIRKALNQLSLRTQVEGAIAASGDQNLVDGWGYASEFESDNPLVIGMRETFGMTVDQMYAAFQLAATL